MGANVAKYVIDSYDALGRPHTKRQHFWQGSGWSPAYAVQHAYDLVGNVKTQTYPSGRTVNYSYDQAGRLSSSSGNLGGSPYTYADTIGYNAAGQMIKERFGTNTSLYHNLHYNNRLQLVDTRLGDSATDEWSWSRGAIAFFYGTTAANSWNQFANDTDNNGNLRRQMNFVPLAGGGDAIPQVGDYTYDALNRIATFREQQRNGSGQWAESASQDFIYDRYGNRKVTSASSGVSSYNPSYDLATNRINGLGYDAAGNITSDPLTGGTMTYDPENRLLTATSGGGGSYTYDADGRRVKRITGGQETWHIYGCGGELLAEYAAGAQPTAPQKEYGYRNGQLLVIVEPGSGGNLAWGKVTSQSSTGWGGNSSRGVDGNTNGSWSDNSVTHTQFEHQPWWQVDLGSVQQIGTVKLWNRTDCCGERLSNFHVLVSDNPFSSTDLTATINQAGVSNYYTAGQAGALTEIGVGRSGRYVRVQLAGDNYLSLAEVEVMAGTASGEGVKWLVQDHLGSTRMVVDRTGSLGGIKRHDFAPFGEELVAGVGIRSASIGYSADSVRQRYTGYERDGETGLDFAQARYFSNSQGRFASIDPLYYQAMMAIDPQRFNLYAYSRNNPLKFIDPDGERVVLRGDPEWIVTNILNELAGGLFNEFFYISNGEVSVNYGAVESAIHNGGISSGVALLLELVESPSIFLYFAGDNDDGGAVADLFMDTRDTKGKLNKEGKEIADTFTGNNPTQQGGYVLGTTGIAPGGAPQPARLANGDPVYFVFAYNKNMVQTQTAVSYDYFGGFSAQIAGLGQRIAPVSFFIHESSENLVYPHISRFTITRKDYDIAHTRAQNREAKIRAELGITGGFAGGGEIRSRVPRQ
jgi:RHS repeat-associated protein